MAASAFQQSPPPPRDEYGQPMNNAAPAPPPPPPAQVLLPAGTFIRVRVDQPLSSDRNLGGDAFTATLSQAIIADGVVVARRGQIVEGVVAGALRAGRRQGPSRLALELVQVSLVDGRQVPVQTRIAEFSGGGHPVRRDAELAAVATATGAVIGAGAAGGAGAAIGAAVGAAAAGIGVLATRGRSTEIYPEDELTFRTIEPLMISTERAPQVFVPARQEDYERRLRAPAGMPVGPPPPPPIDADPLLVGRVFGSH